MIMKLSALPFYLSAITVLLPAFVFSVSAQQRGPGLELPSVGFPAASHYYATDFESGFQTFIIERDGKKTGQVPKNLKNRYGRSLFQGMSYGDTPVMPLLKFEFVDQEAKEGGDHKYRVIAVNSAGLKSR